MKELMNEYKMYLQEKGRTKNTIAGYGYDVNSFIKFLKKKNKHYLNADSNDVFEYIDSLKSCNATINRVCIGLNSFYKYLSNQGLIVDVPDCNYYLKVNVKEPDYISKDVMERILKALDTNDFIGIRNYCMLKVLYCTGIHISELLDLALEDVRLDINEIVIENGKHSRTISINQEISNLLEDYLKARSLMNVSTDKFFVNARGGKMTRQGGNNIFKNCCDSAHITDKFNLNTLRNSFIINAIKDGMRYTDIQKITGVNGLDFLQRYAEYVEERRI